MNSLFIDNTKPSGTFLIAAVVGVTTLIAFLSGCTAPHLLANCIDAKFERKPVERIFALTIENLHTHEETTQNITCQGTYSAHCSERGNHWDWVQVEPPPYPIELEPGNYVYAKPPSCSSFANDSVDEKPFNIKLTDGRFLSLKVVRVKNEDKGILSPNEYLYLHDPDNEYIYYMNEKGKSDKTRPYVVPLGYTFEELK